jgi:hypothetical protein
VNWSPTRARSTDSLQGPICVTAAGAGIKTNVHVENQLMRVHCHVSDLAGAVAILQVQQGVVYARRASICIFIDIVCCEVIIRL